MSSKMYYNKEQLDQIARVLGTKMRDSVNPTSVKSAIDKIDGFGLLSDEELTRLTSIKGTMYLGLFTSETLIPLEGAVSGNYADVDAGGSKKVVRWIYDADENIFVKSSSAVTSAESVKSLYESNTDTNAFTDLYKSKLDTLDVGAEATNIDDFVTSLGLGLNDTSNVLPVPSDETSMFFVTTQRGSANNEVQFSLEIEDSTEQFELYRNDVLICNDQGVMVDDQSCYLDNRYSTIRFSTYKVELPRSDGAPIVNEYRLVGASPKVNIILSDDLNSVRIHDWSLDITQFSSSVSAYNVNTKHAKLTVPTYLPPVVTSLNYMFNNCYEFNTNISTWDTSNVVDFSNFIYVDYNKLGIFNQNLSGWNTTSSEYQIDLEESSLPSSWTKPKPIIDRRNKNFTGTPYTFTTTQAGTERTDVVFSLRINDAQPDIKLYKNDVLVVSGEMSVPTENDVSANTKYGTTTIYVNNSTNPSIDGVDSIVNTYRLEGTSTHVVISMDDNPIDGVRDWEIDVTQFSSAISGYQFQIYNTKLTVPEVLPAVVNSLDFMFNNTYNFNDDISMWDVSKVQSFNGFIYNNMTSRGNFNKDLSSWVTTSATQGNDYPTAYPVSWVLPKPTFAV